MYIALYTFCLSPREPWMNTEYTQKKIKKICKPQTGDFFRMKKKKIQTTKQLFILIQSLRDSSKNILGD